MGKSDTNVLDYKFCSCGKDAEIYCRASFYAIRTERTDQLLHQPQVIADSFEEISVNAKPLVRRLRKLPKRVKKLIEMLPQQEVPISVDNIRSFVF